MGYRTLFVSGFRNSLYRLADARAVGNWGNLTSAAGFEPYSITATRRSTARVVPPIPNRSNGERSEATRWQQAEQCSEYWARDGGFRLL